MPDEKALTPETLDKLLHHISDTAEAPWLPANPDTVEDCNAMWLSWIEHELVELGVHLGAWKADRQRIEALERGLRFDIRFWRGWAVKLEPRLDVLAAEQHITPEDIERAAGLHEEAGTDGPTTGAPNA